MINGATLGDIARRWNAAGLLPTGKRAEWEATWPPHGRRPGNTYRASVEAATGDLDTLRAAVLRTRNVRDALQAQIATAEDGAMIAVLAKPAAEAQRELDRATAALGAAEAAASQTLDAVLADFNAQPLGVRRETIKRLGLVIIGRPATAGGVLVAYPDDMA